MKSGKKIISALVSAAVISAAAAAGTVMSGAQGAKLDLIYTPLPSGDSAGMGMRAIGQDLFAIGDTQYTFRSVLRIDEDMIEEWRSTGKAAPERIKLGKSISNKDLIFFSDLDFRYGDYGLIAYIEGDSYVYKIVKYDSNKKTISSVFTSKNRIGVSPDGDIGEIMYDYDKSMLKLRFLKAQDREYRSDTYSFDLSKINSYTWYTPLYGSDKATFELFGTGSYLEGTESEINGGEIFTVDSKGNKTVVAGRDAVQSAEEFEFLSFFDMGEDFICYWTYPDRKCCIYYTDTGKTYQIDNNFVKELAELVGTGYRSNSFLGNIYGTTAILQFSKSDDPSVVKYVLVDIENNKLLSGVYDYICTSDGGKTYCCKEESTKVSYLDAEGNELASFDDADDFCGDGEYAPVIYKGRMFLVDRNMKRVSKAYKVDEGSYVASVADDLFVLGNNNENGKNYIVTFKG